MAVLQPNRELIAPPPTQRVRYGLFTAGAVVPMSNRMLGNGLQFYADHCGEFTELYNQECGVESPVKTPNEGAELVGTDPFWLETRLRCGTVGRTADEIKAAAQSRLTAAEQRRVEDVLWNGIAAQPDVLNLVNNAGTTIVTPLAPGAGAALAALENAFYQMTGHVGTIHVNVQAEGALEYAGFLNPESGVLRTRMGSAVSLGAGYGINGPDDTAPEAGFVWAFMTAYTTVWRSTDAQIPQPDPRRVMDRVANQWDVVSERVYAAAWACPEVVAVQVPVAAPATAATPAVPA
ncbi:hypothetical protein ACIQ9R_37580 [Streptomyces sp. NPDC094447]|uniref:hypothetical protein n=1 Tax=Streptomyces sp. NPDC094447 TaxID=3366062 RepID=UPI00382D0869